MTPPLVIAFGYKARSGKDFCVSHLIETYHDKYDIRRYAFGDELKVELYDTLMNSMHPFWLGPYGSDYLLLPHPREQSVNRTHKIAWIDENKTALRKYLQWYGTEYRRATNPFYWVNKLHRQIFMSGEKWPQIALISDLRFKSEFAWVRSLRGNTVKVTRFGYDNPGADHSSEHELDGTQFDYEISCLDGEVDQLRKDAVTVFEMIEAEQQPKIPDLENVVHIQNSST